MANPSDFDVTVTGPERILQKLKEILQPAIEECPGGGYGWGKYNLLTQKLFADIDPEREHTWVGLGLNQDQAIIGPSFDSNTGKHSLYLEGSAKWAPPYELIDRLSKQFPELEFRLGATTDDFRIDIWVVKNGGFTLVELWFSFHRLDITMYCVREGTILDVPEFEDESYNCQFGDGTSPHPIIPDDEVEFCSGIYRKYLGRECPGVESGQLAKSLRELVKSRAQRFDTQPDITSDEEPSEQVRQMAEELAAREKSLGAESSPVANQEFSKVTGSSNVESDDGPNFAQKEGNAT